jgi:hypothetical protein
MMRNKRAKGETKKRAKEEERINEDGEEKEDSNSIFSFSSSSVLISEFEFISPASFSSSCRCEVMIIFSSRGLFDEESNFEI